MRGRYRIRFIILLSMVVIMFIFSGCGGESRQITISTNVLQDDAKEELMNAELEKVKDLDVTALKDYNFVCWKDDENLIFNRTIDDANKDYYNYNISNPELKKTVSLPTAGNIIEGLSTHKRQTYIKDNKLWVYNFITGENRHACDLSEIKNLLESDYKKATLIINDGSYVVYNPERSYGTKGDFKVDNAMYYPLLGVHMGDIDYTDRYIYISYRPDYYDGDLQKKLYIADLETGKLTECPAEIDGAAINREPQITYSKEKDTFYIQGTWFNKKPVDMMQDLGSVSAVYEFKLGDIIKYKEVNERKDGYVSEISEDGRYIYYIVLRSSKAEAGKYDYYNIDSVVKYDTEQNSTINVFKNNSETRYSFTYFNYKNNLVKYRVGDENIGEITRGVGFLNIDRINELVNSNLLKSKDTNESHEVIYMNDKGNKILAVTIENCVTADNPKGADRITGYTLYEIRNLSGN